MKIKNIYKMIFPALLGLGAMTARPVAAVDTGLAPGLIAVMQGSPQRQAAEAGLVALTNRLIAAGDHADAPRIMAVDHYEQLRRATLGYGFQINLLEPKALLAGASIAASMHPGDEWRFVVLIDARPVGLISVANMQGRWQMVMAGASEMAREIASVPSRYTNQNAALQMRFLRSEQGVMDLIQITAPAVAGASPAVQYVPLLSARNALMHYAADVAPAAEAAATLSEAQILPTLRDSVQDNIRHFQLAR